MKENQKEGSTTFIMATNLVICKIQVGALEVNSKQFKIRGADQIFLTSLSVFTTSRTLTRVRVFYISSTSILARELK